MTLVNWNTIIRSVRYIECGVYGDRIVIYPMPCSIYLRGTIRYLGSCMLFQIHGMSCSKGRYKFPLGFRVGLGFRVTKAHNIESD